MNSKDLARLVQLGWSVSAIAPDSWVTKFRNAVTGGTCMTEEGAWGQALNIEGESRVLPTVRQADPDIAQLQFRGYDVAFDVHAVRNCWMVSFKGETVSKGHASREDAWDAASKAAGQSRDNFPVTSLLRDIGYSTLYHNESWECLYRGSVVARGLADESAVWAAAQDHLKKQMDEIAKLKETFNDYKGKAKQMGFALGFDGGGYIWVHRAIDCRSVGKWTTDKDAWRAAFNWARCNAALFKDV